MPENLRVLVVLVGMALLSLFVAGLVSKYESYMARKRSIAMRLLRGASHLESVMELIPKGAVPQGFGRWMRQEILARYLAIKKIMPGHPGINVTIRQSGQLLEQEPPGLTEATPPSVAERAQLDAYWKGLGGALDVLKSHDAGGGLNQEERSRYYQFILLLKAESANAHFTQKGSRLAESGNYAGALAEVRALDVHFQAINLASKRFLELKGKNKTRYVEYFQQQLSV